MIVSCRFVYAWHVYFIHMFDKCSHSCAWLSQVVTQAFAKFPSTFIRFKRIAVELGTVFHRCVRAGRVCVCVCACVRV